MVMAKEDRESLPRIADEESPTNALFSSRNRCFHLPCFGPRQAAPAPASRSGTVSSTRSSPWERLSFVESEGKWWWSRPFRALKKIREWSEIVAGPKWKTFIRRFNRNRSGGCGGGGGGGHKHGNFQYDPLSYALNFDEGAQIGQSDEDYGYYPDFTSRYVSGTLSAKTSMDLGRGSPPAG